MTAAPHVCAFCGKRHKAGAKAFDRSGNRCAKNCTRKPAPVSRPHPWVGKSACALCGSTTPRGQSSCTNRDVCVARSLSSLKVIRPDDAWIRQEYELAMAAGGRELAMAA